MKRCFQWRRAFLFLFLCLSAITATAQQAVKGKVTDAADGAALPGVNVTVPGTQAGAATDANGNFSITLPAGAASLRFSFVGYDAQTVAVGAQTTINVRLQAASKGLGEVVVVGYGTQTRRDLTGTVSQVKGADIRNLPVSDPAQAIQGRVTGVNIVRSDASPGTTPSIRIRGTGTINDAEPLIVIDGVPAGGLSDVNPNDIASMEILKDASASAIYGTRAANGVVLITTRKGNFGEKLRASVNVYRGVSDALRYVDLLTAPDLVMLKKERYANDGIAPNPVWNDPYYSVQRTDWQKAVLGTGHVTNADAQIRGGNAASNYLFSLGYYDEKGIIENSYFKRYTARINSEHKLGKRVKIGENLQLSLRQNQGFDTYSSQTGLLFSTLRFNPAIPVRNEDGSYGTGKASSELGDINNPVFTLETSDSRNKYYRMLANIYGELEIINGLKLRANGAFDGGLTDNYYFNPQVLDQTRVRDRAELSRESRSNSSLLGEIFLNFKRTFAAAHDIDVTGGYSVQTFKGDYYRAERRGYNDESPDQRVLDNGDILANINGNFDPDRALASGFVRAFYGYKGKYLLTLTFRADGSSRFSPDNRWGYFPAFSAGWRISEEKFMKDNLAFISNLKLTGGWGVLGNSNVADFQYLAPINKDRRYSFGGTAVTGIWNSRLANPDITWEKAKMTNVSLEAGFLENRLTTTVTWFVKNTTDMLVPAPEMDVHGRAGIPDRNIGELKNTGWEVEAGYRGNAGAFTYNISANASFIKNTVTRLYEPGTYIGSASYGRQQQEISRTYEGQPIASFFGWRTNGIYQTQDEINRDPALANDSRKTNIAPGDVRFVDQNNDGKIDEGDRVYLGSPNPDVVYGLQLGAEYKGFDFSASFSGVAGVKLYNADKMQGLDPTFPFNYYAEALNRWHGPGTSNTMPRMTTLNNNGNYRTSDRFVENGNYLSLRNVALGYTIPPSLWGNSGITGIRVYVACQNLFILTDYSGLNPELGYTDGNRQRGVDVATYPAARTFTFGASLNF
ncbi:TonB-dependent receptor [Chitinophaga lutea]|uniref:TonB-dependent receptor n=1 Tax=Chitinophaga lutea TaxID=2488634 RepID=A0A3N4PIH9_9BACT|nr:TonB-dependent receptor [Chitinophaga lutea]RPE08483.1 TonB-dependent receptor [Chitinophaga lutea]